MTSELICGDCTEVLPTLPAASVDCVITDPPYPCIKRQYGVWTEAEWFALMRQVVPECMRVLKPTGSAVFILQPNSERVGRMRTWLWEFMAWAGKEWGIVQDVWWWNNTTPPNAGSTTKGLLRSSVKSCVWIGPAECYRNQGDVLGPVSRRHQNRIQQYAGVERSGEQSFPCGANSMDYARACRAARTRGGTTPFNMLVMHHGAGQQSAGAHGHGAGTPAKLADWWLRYLCPPQGLCLDPFSGSGTVPLAALKQGKSAIGIERLEEYHQIARRRVNDFLVLPAKPSLF